METSAATTGPASAPGPLAGLRAHGVLIQQAPGLVGWDGTADEVFAGLEAALSRLVSRDALRVLRFPPVLSRELFERSAFAHSFPQLFGSVHAFTGDRRAHQELTAAMEHGEDWADRVRLTDFVLAPAACYPVYPLYTGELPAARVGVDVSGYCFRHEPSDEPGRLVAFRQREFVTIADPDGARRAFTGWQARALGFITDLGLSARLETAADPFFGAGSRLLAASQREQNLKFEVLAPIGDHEVAVASCNYHRDHFGRAFDIRAAGAAAHTTCVGFGLERIVLALFATHGPAPKRWPAEVGALLWS